MCSKQKLSSRFVTLNTHAMMFGGGFIGQMMETTKKNRELLGKSKKEPFKKSDYKEGDAAIKLVDTKQLSDTERLNLIQQLKIQARKEQKKKVRILLISTCVTVLIFYILSTTLFSGIIEFLKR